ncbi:MAG: RNA polymerase sigma factor [Bacteroidales bacterium]|nr:RNA polymerase sigma factor [Bacteroidales bacterium]
MEEHIVKLLKAQHRRAQKEVYEKYAERMFVHCMRYINNEQDAESIVNQSFYKMFMHIGHFEYRDGISFEAWIKRIVINETLMFIRQNKRMDYIEDIKNLDSHDNNNTLKQLEAEEYFILIQSLPIGFRTVFNLYAIEGYSHQEIAEKLNISESTSRSQLTRAREILREKIKRIER